MQIRNALMLMFVSATIVGCVDTDSPVLDNQGGRLSAEAARAERRLLASKRGATPTRGGAPTIASATDMAAALDIPAGAVSGAELTSPDPEAALVATEFGVIQPRRGSSLVVMSTGRLNNLTALPEPGTDFDPLGAHADAVTLRIMVNVPDGANRMSFDFNFLSAESPDYVGSLYNDTFIARVSDSLGVREVARATVNSSFFYDVSATRAGGTLFDVLFADDPSGVDDAFGSYPPTIQVFPDAGLTGFRTVTAEVVGGGTVTLEFDIRDLEDGFLDSAVVIDNVAFSSTERVDPNPSLIDPFSGSVRNEPADLARLGAPTHSVAADGITQLLLRVKVPGPGQVQFTLPSGSAATQGSFSAVGSSARNSTLTVAAQEATPGKRYAFALYTSPEDFNTGGDDAARDRTVNVGVQYTPDTGTGFQDQFEIKVVRPPVVVAPEMWSAGCLGWKGSASLFTSPLFDLTCATYADHPASSSDSLSSNMGRLAGAVFDALNKARGRGIAVTQVDVIAHGVGGILTRKFVDWPGYYSRDNFFMGNINRIIFMNSPLAGTRLADEIVVMRDDLMANNPAQWSTVEAALEGVGVHIDNAGVDELETDSTAINAIRETRVPSHLMVTSGGRPLPRNVSHSMLNDSVKVLVTQMENNHPLVRGLSFTEKRKLILGPESKIFCADANGVSDDHDLFAAIEDQKGGVVDTNVLTNWDVVSGDGSTGHFGLYNDALHNARLITLLNSSTNGQLFAPSIPSPQDVVRVNHCASGLSAAGWNGSAGPIPRPVGSLAITSPVAGTPVTPGGDVKVRVDAQGGFQPQVVLVVGAGRAAVLEAPPFVADLSIPKEVIGKVELVAFGLDANGAMLASEPVVLPVASSAALTSMEVMNGDFALRGPGSTRRLLVLGHYDDGVMRNISSPDLGTVYSSSNTHVVAVTGDGMVTGVGAGIATIAMRNGAALASVTVTVSDNSPPVAKCRDVVVPAGNVCRADAVVDDGSYDPNGGEVKCVQTPGGPYSLGKQRVTLTCQDAQGLTASCEAAVTVMDDSPPELMCPAQEVVECQGGSGVATYAPVATDSCGGAQVACTPTSGTSFPLGTTAVVCAAVDEAGNRATCAFPVRVQDTQAPSVTCPPPVTAECTGNGGATVELGEAVASDSCSAVSVSGPSGGRYPVGVTQLTYTARDTTGNEAQCTTTVTVADTAPPVVTVQGLGGTWPPNHQYRTVSLEECGITVGDACGGTPVGVENAVITCVTSDEVPDGRGDGSTGADVVLADQRTVKLRAERSGTGDGRVYRIHFRIRDGAGNETPGVCVAPVPHDRRGGAPSVDSGEAWRVCRP